ncbi:hypothetical protein BT96DRAFT_610082 [Gymnopus androsaceus JB14]|uniref:Uncharacterized protein n=1 Tax=Gymnopus androsaceus JB14 TaxID=1447944 RepID=A0A6A4HXI0_9AGAR|nr:hypothetical protein BT96DRAFT_610082 [Gymnopus androsaceus JB14]
MDDDYHRLHKASFEKEVPQLLIKTLALFHSNFLQQANAMHFILILILSLVSVACAVPLHKYAAPRYSDALS